MNLGKRIKYLRESKGLTQEDVFTGIVSNSHYSNIENGRYNGATDTLKLIASRLGVPEDYLNATNFESNETEILLGQYESLIEKGDSQSTNTFLEFNKNKFDYIPSFKQEFYYQLLTFLHLLNSSRYKEALELFKRYPINEIKIDLDGKYKQKYLYSIGLFYYLTEEHRNSIKLFKELLTISNENSSHIPRVLYNIGMSLYNIYKLSDAMEYVKESKLLYLKSHEWEKVGDCYNILVVLNRELKDYSTAEMYLEKGFNIAKKESFELKAKLFHNHSLICYDQKRYKEALDYVNKSLEIKKENFLQGLFVSYKLKVNILLKIDDLLMLNNTLKIASEYISSQVQEAQYLYLEAKKYYIFGDLSLYENNISRALKILQSQRSWKDLRSIAEEYSLFLEKNNRYKSSLEFLKISNVALKNMYEEG